MEFFYKIKMHKNKNRINWNILKIKINKIIDEKKIYKNSFNTLNLNLNLNTLSLRF